MNYVIQKLQQLALSINKDIEYSKKDIYDHTKEIESLELRIKDLSNQYNDIMLAINQLENVNE